MSIYKGGNENGGVSWGYFDKFDNAIDKYVPDKGEGETLASQIATAVNKIIYGWYNDGDAYCTTSVFDACNDLSPYANWLAKTLGEHVGIILNRVFDAATDAEYERILKDLADICLNDLYLGAFNTIPKEGTIYKCDGEFNCDRY